MKALSRSKYLKAWRKKNHKKYRKTANAYNRKYNRLNKEKTRRTKKRYLVKLKKDILTAYGNKCAVCNTRKDLTLDHKLGNGKQHRAKAHGDHTTIYAEVRRQGFPKDKYRLLCRKHNTSEWFRLFWKGKRRPKHNCPKCGHKFWI